MSKQKVAIIGNADQGVIGARALIEKTVSERESPALLIIPDLTVFNEKALKDIINSASIQPRLIITKTKLEEVL